MSSILSNSLIALEKKGSTHHQQSCFYSHFARLYSCICCTYSTLHVQCIYKSGNEGQLNLELESTTRIFQTREALDLVKSLRLWLSCLRSSWRTPAPRPAFVYRRAHIYIIPAILSFCGQPFDRWSDHGGSRTSWYVKKVYILQIYCN